MDFSNLMQGFYPTILGVLIGAFLPRLFQKKDKQNEKCEVHNLKLFDFENRLIKIESKVENHENEITDFKKLMSEIRNDIKTLLQRI